MSLYIPIPRKIVPDLQPRWDIVRRCNGSRRKMVDFITSLGGYSDRHTRYAIAFNVKAHGCDLDKDYLWNYVTEHASEFNLSKIKPEHMAVVRSVFDTAWEENRDHLWEWGQEEAYEGWANTDTPFETWVGERVDWKHEIAGRSGGYICMTECEDINLKCSPEELEEKLMERSEDEGYWLVSDDELILLFIICVQNHIELTPTAATEEIEYRAAWRLWNSFVEDQIPAAILAYETRERLTEDAKGIAQVLREHATLEHCDVFNTICFLAGITINED